HVNATPSVPPPSSSPAPHRHGRYALCSHSPWPPGRGGGLGRGVPAPGWIPHPARHPSCRAVWPI
ncbi:unnamed protein product, partial [Rangifer tarandus platyrhynchus]